MARTLVRIMVVTAALVLASAAWADSPKTPQEAKIVAQIKAAYQQHGLPFTQQDEDNALARYRKIEGAVINAKVMTEATPNAGPAQKLAILTGTLRSEGLGPQGANAKSSTSQPASMSRCEAAAAQAGPGAVCEPRVNGTPIPVVADAQTSQPTNATTPTAGTSISAAQLVTEISQRHAQGALTVFVPRQDGFVANGQTFVDPMGQIVMFGGDTASGDVTYFVRNTPGTLLVRFANVHSPLAPITVGTIQLQPDMMRFTSVDGTEVAGENVIPAGQGVIVARATTVFDYTFGQAPTHQLLPASYELAPYQRGDVAATNYVLLRRDISPQQKGNVVNAFAGLFHAVTGTENDKDFALFNVRTGNTVYLNVSEVGEQVGHGVNCRPKNAFVNRCGGWVSHAALYEDDGQPNILHYYWRIDWAQTPAGPIAVALEKGVENVDAIRLDSDTVKTVFHRALGIKSAMISQNPDGSLAVTANWAFHNHKVPNVDALFASADADASIPSSVPESGVKNIVPPSSNAGATRVQGTPPMH